MNIYNWILAAASPWSDEYHSLFIRPLLILLLHPASITTGCGAADGEDDVHADGGWCPWRECQIIHAFAQCLVTQRAANESFGKGAFLGIKEKQRARKWSDDADRSIQMRHRLDWRIFALRPSTLRSNLSLMNKCFIFKNPISIYMQVLWFSCLVFSRLQKLIKSTDRIWISSRGWTIIMPSYIVPTYRVSQWV